MLGFDAVRVGGIKKLSDAADIFTRTPLGRVLVVECTTDVLDSKDKLRKLLTRVEEAKVFLSAAMSGSYPGPRRVSTRAWIDTRNYYTHWDEAERGSVLDGVEMHRAGVRMKHLLRALYLYLVWIPQEAILAALRNQVCNENR
jgi:ApeA N-terminal domain 1